MKNIMKRYKFAFLLIAVNMIFLFSNPVLGRKSVSITAINVMEMLSVLPPIFILLGLLDVWVERETMIKLMGEKSGFVGAILAFLLGSLAAGPLYAAFPIAGILLKKGSKFSNVLIFIGAWSTTKVPMLLFETTSMGWKFMLTRFIIDIFGIAIIAYITEKALKTEEKKEVYKNATLMK